MVFIHGKSKRKPTGGRYTDAKTKRLHQVGNHPTHTKIAEKHVKAVHAKGGLVKTKLLASNKANVYDPTTKKHSVEDIKNVAENKANVQFVRHNVLTKGAVIVTSKGKARITNRPGQEGVVNAIIVN